MDIQFTSPMEHPAGTVFNLLKQAWHPVWTPELEEKIRQFDCDVNANPRTVVDAHEKWPEFEHQKQPENEHFGGRGVIMRPLSG